MNMKLKTALFVSLVAVAGSLFAGQTRAEQTKLTGAKAIAKFPARLQNSDIAHLKDAVWCEVMDGVEYFYGEFDKLYDTTANDVYYFKIDYQRAKVRMEFVDNRRNGGSNKKTSAVAKANNALFGINCTFPQWFAKMDGAVVKNGNKEGGLALNDNKTFTFFKSDWWKTHPDADGFRDAFSTEALGLYHGKLGLTGTTWGKAPYTFMGATQDGGTVYICVVDGRTTRSQGLGYGTVHDFLVELGCYDGMCLDGGGSTTMVCRKDLMPASGMSDRQHDSEGSDNHYTMNYTVDTSTGGERAVCNQLMFVACEAPETAAIPQPTAIAGLVYDGTEKTGVPVGDNYIISGNTATNAGSYTASATPRWGYCWPDKSTDPVVINWSIAKATLKVSDVTGSAISYGDTLASSVATGAVEPDVAGSFVWTNPDVKPTLADSGVTAYAGTFVPEDAANYLSASFTATVTVNRREIAVPTARTGLACDFSEQTGVEAGEGYALTGEKAMLPGDYVATATLTDKANTCWADDKTTADKSIAWSIGRQTPEVSGAAEAGTDWNGSDVTFDIGRLNLGSHTVVDVLATFEVNGKTYGGAVTERGGGAYRVAFAVDAEGENGVVAAQAYEGTYRLTVVGGATPVEIACGAQTLLQGVPATETNGWFRETAAVLGQTGAWTKGGEPVDLPVEGDRLVIEPTGKTPLAFTPTRAMDERTKGVIEATVLFESPSEDDADAPGGDVQCAVRIAEDDETGAVELQVYAALPDGNGGWNVGWQDWNQPAAAAYSFVAGTEYAIRLVCDYETGSNALTCLVRAAGEDEFTLLFRGYLSGAATGANAPKRIASLEFEGTGKMSCLNGDCTRDFLDASVAAVGGLRYATVADAVAAAGGATITLLHRASWKPASAEEQRAAKFANPELLVLDGAEPEVIDANRIGVCSWSWHDNMTSILARMKKGGFKGMQLALSPWIWDAGEATAAQAETFGDVEGEEVLALIREKAAAGEIVIHATMIAFADEDYTSTTTISNTCGLFYGLAPSATDGQKANAESKWAHRSNQFERAAILTGELGVPYLTAHLGLCGLDDAAKGYPRLAWACKVCKDHGCKLLIETGMYSAEVTAALLGNLVQAHPELKGAVGLNFDTANLILYGTDTPTHAFPILRQWIDQVHVKDCVEDLSRRGGWATDVEWGLGDVSQKYDFIAYLRENGFKGPLLVEHESGQSTADARAREILTAVQALLTSNNADDPACTTPDWINPSLMEGDTPVEKAAAAMKAQGFDEGSAAAVAAAGEGAYETVAKWAQTWADGWEARGESVKPRPADISRLPGVLTSAAIGATPPLTEQDVRITELQPSGDGAVTVTVSLGEYENLKSGNEALLRAALGVTGAYQLGDGAFSADNVDVTAKAVGIDAIELEAVPKEQSGAKPTRFFFRATAK